MGREGGQAVLKKYGTQHFREMGRRGFESLVNRYFSGDRDAALVWLRARASEKLVDRLLQETPSEGAVQCTEIPVYILPEDDPTFTEPSTWQERVAKAERTDAGYRPR
jgi:hypothetical protein